MTKHFKVHPLLHGDIYKEDNRKPKKECDYRGFLSIHGKMSEFTIFFDEGEYINITESDKAQLHSKRSTQKIRWSNSEKMLLKLCKYARDAKKKEKRLYLEELIRKTNKK